MGEFKNRIKDGFFECTVCGKKYELKNGLPHTEECTYNAVIFLGDISCIYQYDQNSVNIEMRNRSDYLVLKDFEISDLRKAVYSIRSGDLEVCITHPLEVHTFNR